MTPSGSRRYLMRAVLCLTVGSTGLFWCGRPATTQAQVGPPRSAPDADVPAALATPGPTAPPSDRAHMVDAAEAEGATASLVFLTETLPPGARTEMGLLGLIGESIFGNRSDLWRPLSLGTFFTEGWLEPWYPCQLHRGAAGVHPRHRRDATFYTPDLYRSRLGAVPTNLAIDETYLLYCTQMLAVISNLAPLCARGRPATRSCARPQRSRCLRSASPPSIYPRPILYA
jgi:hypothetical protein